MMMNESRPLDRISRIVRKLLLNRYTLSFLYLRGEGIEIGALHNPLRVAPWTRVRYVDRMTVSELRQQYPELNGKRLVSVDIVADGELLECIGDECQDFVIANHFIEHCQNPLLAMENMFRVLRQGGVLYLALPDKRYTFDRDRPVTSLDHLIRDYQEGPHLTRQRHFEEWVSYVNGVADEREMRVEAGKLLQMDYSIHYHAWTQLEMMEMLLHLRGRILFDMNLVLKYKNEVVFILRKG